MPSIATPFPAAAAVFLRGAQFLRGALTLAVLVLTAFAFGGVTQTPEFAVRVAALILAVSTLLRVLFFPRVRSSHEDDRLVRNAVLLMLPFLAFSALQIAVGDGIYGGVLPGSINPFMGTLSLLHLIAYLAIFISFYDYFWTRKRVRAAVLALALSLIPLISTGFYHQFSELETLKRLYGIDLSQVRQHYSFFLHTNYYGGYLAIIVPSLFASICYEVRHRIQEKMFHQVDVTLIQNLFYLLLLPVMVLSAYAAESRAAVVWIGLLGILGVLALPNTRKHRGAILLAGVVALGLLWMAGALSRGGWQTIQTDIEFRRAVSEQCLLARKDFPIFGYGVGASKYILPSYQVRAPETGSIPHPYNHFFELLLEAGIPGFLLFMLPIVYLLLASIKPIWQCNSRWTRIFGACSWVGVVSSVMPSLVDRHLATPAIAVILLFHLAVLSRVTSGGLLEAEVKTPARFTWDAGRLIVLIAAVAALFFGIRALSGLHEAEVAVRSRTLQIQRLQEVTKRYPTFVEAWMEVGRYHMLRAKQQLDAEKDFKSDAERAVKAYLMAVKRSPMWSQAWEGLGEAEILVGRRKQGMHHVGFAIQLQPFNRDRYIYALLLSARLSIVSPWQDDRRYFKNLALAWIDKAGEVLGSPVTEQDFGYRGHDGRMTPDDVNLLKGMLREYYVSAGKRAE